MKKRIIISSLAIAFLAMGNVTIAQSPEPEAPVLVSEAATEMPPTMIDDIAIPFEVLMYAQMKYQGHAVVGANKIVKNGGEVYELRVDRSDNLSDYEGYYLHYDMEWKLLGEEQMVAPPSPDPKPRVPAPVEVEEEVETSDPQPATLRNIPGEGRGGGFVEDEEAQPPVPEDEEVEEVEDEVEGEA